MLARIVDLDIVGRSGVESRMGQMEKWLIYHERGCLVNDRIHHEYEGGQYWTQKYNIRAGIVLPCPYAVMRRSLYWRPYILRRQVLFGFWYMGCPRWST